MLKQKFIDIFTSQVWDLTDIDMMLKYIQRKFYYSNGRIRPYYILQKIDFDNNKVYFYDKKENKNYVDYMIIE